MVLNGLECKFFISASNRPISYNDREQESVKNFLPKICNENKVSNVADFIIARLVSATFTNLSFCGRLHDVGLAQQVFKTMFTFSSNILNLFLTED